MIQGDEYEEIPRVNEQEAWWAGEFGDAYVDRCRVNWLDRVPFWTHIMALTGAHSAIELGANVGWNLLALRTVMQHPGFYAQGFDINPRAVEQAKRLGLTVDVGDADTAGCVANAVDLTFTCGVLIHVAPKDLLRTMELLVRASRRWVLAVEYDAEHETEVEYRGHSERLWKRSYGALYERFGLLLLERGEAQGFDRCHYWLMEKR